MDCHQTASISKGCTVEKPRLLFQVVALSSSLIFVTGYVAFRAGALHQAAVTPVQTQLACARTSDQQDSHGTMRKVGFDSPPNIEPDFQSRENPFEERSHVNQIGAIDDGEFNVVALQGKLAQFAANLQPVPVMAGSKSAIGIVIANDLVFGQQSVSSHFAGQQTSSGEQVVIHVQTQPVTAMAGSKSIVMIWSNQPRTTRDHVLDFFNRQDKNKNGILNQDELTPHIWKKLESMEAVTDDYVNWRVLEEKQAEFYSWLNSK
jgi:hypothetical protein